MINLTAWLGDGHNVCCWDVYFLFVNIENLQDNLMSVSCSQQPSALQVQHPLVWSPWCSFHWFLQLCWSHSVASWRLLVSIPLRRKGFCLSLFLFSVTTDLRIYFVYQLSLSFLCWNYSTFGQGGLLCPGLVSRLRPCFRPCSTFVSFQTGHFSQVPGCLCGEMELWTEIWAPSVFIAAGAQISLWDTAFVSFGFIPRSTTAGLYGRSGFRVVGVFFENYNFCVCNYWTTYFFFYSWQCFQQVRPCLV